MNEALIISNMLLWIAVLVLLVALLALARQIGILYERVAPMGALMMDSGPRVGEFAPDFELAELGGGAVRLGAMRAPGAPARATLLFFLSPTCPVCKKLLPILKSVKQAEGERLELVLASDGDDVAAHQAFRE